MKNNPILDPIPFLQSLSDLSRQLRIREGSARQEELRDLLGQAQTIARPKAMIKIAFIEEIRDDHA